MWNSNKGGNKCLKRLKEFGDLEIISFSFLDSIYIVKRGKLKDKKFFIKKVKDANSVTKSSYNKLLLISAFTDYYPLIIAEKYNKKNELKEGVIHYFKEVPMLKEESFLELLEEGKLYFEQEGSIKLVLNNEKVGRSKFINLSDEELKYLSKISGKDPFNNELMIKIKEIAKSLTNKYSKPLENLNINRKIFSIFEEFLDLDLENLDNLIKFKTPFTYLEKENSLVIKEINKFDKSKEKKLLKFTSHTNEKLIYLSKLNKKIKYINDNVLIIPRDFY